MSFVVVRKSRSFCLHPAKAFCVFYKVSRSLEYFYGFGFKKITLLFTFWKRAFTRGRQLVMTCFCGSFRIYTTKKDRAKSVCIRKLRVNFEFTTRLWVTLDEKERDPLKDIKNNKFWFLFLLLWTKQKQIFVYCTRSEPNLHKSI